MIKFKPIDSNLTPYIQLLPGIFSKYQHVVLSYIFGSYAEGKITPLSDIDIAYLFEYSILYQHSLELELQLESEISHILKTDEVDCICLNKAPIEIQYKIIAGGKKIYIKDEAKRTLYEASVITRYLDFKYYVDRQKAIFIENIKNERY